MNKDEFDAQLLRDLSVAYTQLDEAHAELTGHRRGLESMRTEHGRQVKDLEYAINVYERDVTRKQLTVQNLEERLGKMLRCTP